MNFKFALTYNVSNGPRNVVHSYHADRDTAIATRKALVNFRHPATATSQGKILSFNVRPVFDMETGFDIRF